MNNLSTSDKLSVIVVAVLIILTAWGNATVMLIVSILGLVAMHIVLYAKKPRSGYFAATVGFTLAIGFSLVVLFL